MKKYQNKHVQAMFNISPASVRNWANAFEEYLSPAANPPAGQTRFFTDDDLRIFATVHRLKEDEKLTVPEIKEALAKGVLDQAPIEIPGDLLDIAGSSEVQLIIAKLNDFEERLQFIEQGRNAQLQKYIDKKDQRIEELNREIARLELLLEQAQDKNSPQDE